MAAWDRVRQCRSARQLASEASRQQLAVSGDGVGLRRTFQASIVGSRVCLPRAVHRGKLAPNNSFKPNLLRYGKKRGRKSLPRFCLHYASRLNSGVS